MLSINTDINSIRIRNYMSSVTDRLNSCTKTLSTGKKINSASDDAAGLYLSEGIKTRINSFNIGIDAINTGLSILGIAEGTLQNIQNKLLRMRDLAVEGANGTYTSDARAAMQNEADQLKAQMTMEKDSCNFNGKQLLSAQSASSAETPAGGAPSGFNQLTVDDFNNVQTVTLRGTEIQSGEIDGTTYYLVENADQLKIACGGQSGENFVLLSDIDLNGVAWTTQYDNNSTIDGNGYTISHLSITNSASALINSNYGTIKNLGITDSTASGDYSALLCCNNYYGTISNCYVTDSTASGIYSALLCSTNYDGTISNCYVTDSTASGNNSALLCNGNYYGCTISNCYVTDSTVSGNNSALLCYDNNYSGTISNTYALNITADNDVPYVRENYGENYAEVNNSYQDHKESDTLATYKSTEWFSTDEAVTTLGNAFEMVEGKDHPTLKTNPEPVTPQPTPAGGDTMRIQVGYDGNSYSYIELDLGFDLGTINVDLSTAENSANSITEIDRLLNIVNNKQSEIGAAYNRMDSIIQSNTMAKENMSSANSTIIDADIAKENSKYIKNQILQNASQSLLVQASNLNAQIVLGLVKSL